MRNDKQKPEMPQHTAVDDDIAMMRGRAADHRKRATDHDTNATNTVRNAESQANDLIRKAQEQAAELVRQAQENAAELVRQTQEQAAAHVSQARDRAAQLQVERDREASREKYWAGLAAEEAVKAGLPPESPAQSGPEAGSAGLPPGVVPAQGSGEPAQGWAATTRVDGQRAGGQDR